MDSYNRIFDIIELRSGIKENESHRNFIISSVEKRIKELNTNTSEQLSPNGQKISSLDEYIFFVEHNEIECSKLIDLATINETYFFREESHFKYLREHFFTAYTGKQVFIWSAACSTGEESVSLYALAKSIGCKPTIFATDIDTKVLENMKTGSWSRNSFRTDGEKYLPLLDDIGIFSEDQNTWQIKQDDFKFFNISYYNLISDSSLPMPPESVDLVFLRNVFIYFNKQNQQIALKKMWQALKPNGLLFLSVNEITSAECSEEIPFIKEHFEDIYFLRKVSESEFKEKTAKSSRRAQETKPSKKITTFLQTPQNHNTEFKLPHLKKTKDETNEHYIRDIKANDSANATIESLAQDFFSIISEKKYDDAAKLLENYKFKSQNLEYKFYLYGVLYTETTDYKQAIAMLNKAVIANPRFWPAYFKLGLLYSTENQKAKINETFKKCRELLNKAIEQNATEYSFIIEDFDLSYFLKLCDYYLE